MKVAANPYGEKVLWSWLKKNWKERKTDFNSGTLWKYSQTVGSAASGAVTHPGAEEETHIYSDI